jgi:hypothetical protein
MRFGLPGLGMKDTKMGKPKYHYKDSCSWTFQSLNNFKNSYRAIYDKIPVVPVPDRPYFFLSTLLFFQRD